MEVTIPLLNSPKYQGYLPIVAILRYRVLIKYCVFPQNVVIFLNSASSAVALVFYLPGVCTTHTATQVKQKKTRVWNILKSSKKTQYLINTLHIHIKC